MPASIVGKGKPRWRTGVYVLPRMLYGLQRMKSCSTSVGETSRYCRRTLSVRKRETITISDSRTGKSLTNSTSFTFVFVETRTIWSVEEAWWLVSQIQPATQTFPSGNNSFMFPGKVLFPRFRWERTALFGERHHISVRLSPYGPSGTQRAFFCKIFIRKLTSCNLKKREGYGGR
jgi:hypothetical protein